MSHIGTNDEALLRDAADWCLRLRAPELADETLAQWLAWSEQPGHLAAFERMSAMLDDVAMLDEPGRDVLRKASPVARVRPWLPLALAAGLATLALGGYLTWTFATAAFSRDYASEVAQRRDIRLPDGTQVALGAASRLAARFDGAMRRVELREGEAFFQIAPNNAPFEVSVGAVRILDVGTAFDVRSSGDRVTVAVAEGRVRVFTPGHGGVEATAGQRIVYAPGHGVSVARIDPAHAAAWRDDRLEFDNEPLSVVVASLNRYSARPVRIADGELASLGFTGTIRTDAIDHWLEALPQVLPVHVESHPDEIVLTRR